MKYECIVAKSLLSKPIIADSWFPANRSMNAYRGCEFGCVYCDGRAENYHVENFQSHIRIKQNAAEVLRKELTKLGHSSQTVLQSETLIPFLDEEAPPLTPLFHARKRLRNAHIRSFQADEPFPGRDRPDPFPAFDDLCMLLVR